jgi:hypothetical protein
MTLSDLTDLLRAHRVFGLLDEAAFVDLAALFDVEDCPAGAPVSSEDAAGERLGWVLSGAACRPRRPSCRRPRPCATTGCRPCC